MIKNIKYFSDPDDILKSAKKFLLPSQSQNFHPLACSQNFLSSLHLGLFNLPALHQRYMNLNTQILINDQNILFYLFDFV